MSQHSWALYAVYEPRYGLCVAVLLTASRAGLAATPRNFWDGHLEPTSSEG